MNFEIGRYNGGAFLETRLGRHTEYEKNLLNMNIIEANYEQRTNQFSDQLHYTTFIS